MNKIICRRLPDLGAHICHCFLTPAGGSGVHIRKSLYHGSTKLIARNRPVHKSAPSAGGVKKDHCYTGTLKIDVIRSPLNLWSTNFPSSDWCQKLLTVSKPICASKCSYWCFAGGKWGLTGCPFWRHQPVCSPCQTCNDYAKRQLASMPNMCIMCLRIHILWNISFFFFNCLPPLIDISKL